MTSSRDAFSQVIVFGDLWLKTIYGMVTEIFLCLKLEVRSIKKICFISCVAGIGH